MRLLISYAAILAVLLAFANDASGHGGQFRGPGDSVPPGLREPYDPTPPPPPPPPTPTPTPSPTPTPGSPTPAAPVTPGVAPPAGPVTPMPSTPQRGRPGQTSFVDWTFWYHYNNATLENLKRNLYTRLSSPGSLFVTGDSRGGGQRDASTRMTAKKVQEVVVPALLWAMDPANIDDFDTESASYIALAKVTRDPAHIPLLMAGLDLDRRVHPIIREAATLSLGLLRRADPSDQFAPREIDRVRRFLFDVLENDDYPWRTRGFAAIAIGLLGDQPTGSGEYANDSLAAAAATSARIFDLAQLQYASDELPTGLLMALGLQPGPSIDQTQRDALGDCALRGRFGSHKASALVRSHAALALGRIGTTSDIPTLSNVLAANRSLDQNIRRSAAIGLGQLGRLVSGEDRVEVAKALLRAQDRIKDNSTVNFALISLAYLLVEDAKAGRTDVIGGTQADEVLLDTAEGGTYLHQPFAAIGLGLVLRAVDEDVDVEAYQQFRESALTVLRAGVVSTRQSSKGTAAFCTALGIARDDRSRESLREILADRKGDKLLRAYAALGLGLIGQGTPEVVKAIAKALEERSSEELRRQSATALGLLGNPAIPGTRDDAISLLVRELGRAKTLSHKGQIVLALSRIGDHRAVDALVDVLQDPSQKDGTRALACSGLGLIGDLEWIPSLSRGSRDINYRASTDLIREFLTIL